MSACIECSKKFSAELVQAMKAAFPLANERDLPWAACQIPEFLRKRIELEVSQGVFHFTSRVVRVLCEVSPPKNHVEDMARIVVEDAKRWRDHCEREKSKRPDNAAGGPNDRPAV